MHLHIVLAKLHEHINPSGTAPTVAQHIHCGHITDIAPHWYTVTVLTHDSDTSYVRTFEFGPDCKFSPWENGGLDTAYANDYGLLPQDFGDGACIRTDRRFYHSTRAYTDLLLDTTKDID